MKETDNVWVRVKETATALGVRGQTVSMADARFAILAICREEHIELETPYGVEYLAAELVRRTVQVSDLARRRHALKAAA